MRPPWSDPKDCGGRGAQWARDDFEGVFKQGAEEANAYLTSPDYVVNLKKQPGTALTTLEILRENLVRARPLPPPPLHPHSPHGVGCVS